MKEEINITAQTKQPEDKSNSGRVVSYVPFYKDDFIELYCGDAKEIIPSLAPTFDLLLTDPPFFMPATHYQSRVKWKRSWSDTSILKHFWEGIVDLSIEKIKPTGHFLTFCNHESYPVFYPILYTRFDFMKSIIWDKGHVGLGRVWRNQHEMIIAARNNEAVFYEDGKLRADVLKYTATQSKDRLHPVEKPLELMGDLIIPTTQEGGSVLDPFAGGGSTLLAAKKIKA